MLSTSQQPIGLMDSTASTNVASTLIHRPEILFEVGMFLTPADLHRVARASSSLYTVLSSSISSREAKRGGLVNPSSLLCEAVRSYGMAGICTSLGSPLLPSDVNVMLRSLFSMVKRRNLLPEILYVALVLNRDAILSTRWNRCTLLHYFARYGGCQHVNLIAIFGGNLNASLQDLDEQLEAAFHRTCPVVSVPTSSIPLPLFLLGSTPLLHALRFLNIREAETLVEAGADVIVTDEEGRVPLTLAIIHSISSCRLLRGLAATPDVFLIKDSSGQTPLHYAAFYDRYHQLEILLSSPHLVSAFPPEALTCINHEGLTPLEVAVQEGHIRCANILRWEVRRSQRPFSEGHVVSRELTT